MSAVFVLIYFLWRRVGFWGFEKIIGKFYRLGAISYGLYLLHYPILMNLHLLPDDSLFYLDLGLRITLVFLLAWLAEGIGQKRINSFTNRWLLPDQKKSADDRVLISGR
jgi:peptidoglycan/LPS O-acetylase OafA/YrhL